VSWSIRRVPTYIWSLVALISGILLGGTYTAALKPIADGTRAVLSFIVLLAPVLIVSALAPAIATLVRRGLAGRFVGAVIAWFVMSSVIAGLFGLVIAGVVFRLPLSFKGDALAGALPMLKRMGSGGFASAPVIAMGTAVVLGLIGVRSERAYAGLRLLEGALARFGRSVGYTMVPLVFALGIMIGVSFGARLAMAHYGAIIVYSMVMAVIWWVFYVFVLLRFVGRVRSTRVMLKEYYFPTALFAGGTCSSLATIPLNIANLKKYGVRDEVADFVVPVGTIMHKGASAMQYIAYGPLIAGSVFGLAVGWPQLLIAWPFIVLYSMAAPGVPGAMGLGLWTAVLMASVLGLEDPVRTTFIGTWVALTGGIPDMFRSSGNATADGMSAIIFSNNFEKYFGRTAVALLLMLSVGGCYKYSYEPLAQAPVGEDVRVHLSEQGFARLMESRRDFTPASPTIDGKLAANGAGEIALMISLPPNPTTPGLELRQSVSIPASDVLQIERRQLDRTKTTVAAVGAGAVVAGLIVYSVRGTFGGTTTETPPQQSENRVPLFCATRGFSVCSGLLFRVPGIALNNRRR
jgi:Na+/H+-dicarboxylate symporter